MALTRFNPPNNNITTDEIRYHANTFTSTTSETYIPLSNSENLFETNQSINSFIKESNFVFLYDFTYSTLPPLTTAPVNDLYPFTYLTVDVDPPQTYNNPFISTATFADNIAVAFQQTAIYVHATALIYESPTEYSVNLGPGSSIPKLSQGIVFEHYGTVTPRYNTSGYSTQPSETLTTIGVPTSRLRFNSEFNIIDTLNYTGDPNYSTSIPEDDTYTDYLGSSIDYVTYPYHNLIYFDSTNNQFKCKVVPNALVNPRNSDFWDNKGDNGRSYSILIKGTYLLM